jgi:agmatine deiminase
MEVDCDRFSGIEKIIWLKQGLLEYNQTFLGPAEIIDQIKAYTVVITKGLIDKLACFVNHSTILLALTNNTEFEDPIAFENHKRIEGNHQLSSAATDQYNNPFTSIRMPLIGAAFSKIKPSNYVYN